MRLRTAKKQALSGSYLILYWLNSHPNIKPNHAVSIAKYLPISLSLRKALLSLEY